MNRIAPRHFRLHCILFALLLFAGGIPRAHAQVGLYGQFSATHFNSDVIPNTNEWGYGAGFGLYGDMKKFSFARLGGDFRYAFTRPATNTTLTSVLIGPRLDFRPTKLVPLNPYAEVIFGPGRFSYGNNAPSTTQFDFRLIGGLDKTVFPHLDWRVVEVSWGQLNTFSGRLRPITVSTGVVLRLR
jgi:hypothetical protein